MSGVHAVQQAMADDWSKYQAMLRANSSDAGDVAALHALAAKLGRDASQIGHDHSIVRQFDQAESKIASGLSKAVKAAEHAAIIYRQETAPAAVVKLREEQAAAMKLLTDELAADQAKLDAAAGSAQTTYKAGVEALEKSNSFIRQNPQLLSDRSPRGVGVLD
jgi:hypothetical protein